MKSPKRAIALRKLLDLCDDMQRIRTRMADPDLRREARTRLRRQSKRKADQLSKDLSAYRFRGPLGTVMREYRFAQSDFELFAILLQRSMRSECASLEGRLLLASLFDNSFEILAGTELLQPHSPLRASGLVVIDEEEEETVDLLEDRFRLSDEALEALRDEVGGLVPADLSRRKREGYRNNREFLIDLRVLHNLYRSRSERTFQLDRWDRLHVSDATPGRALTRRIHALWERIHKLLRNTEDGFNFPAVKFFRKWNLNEEEIVMVTHLLFKELYEGNAYADAAELVRFVSADEEELIRNRRLVSRSSTLVSQEILTMETMIEGRELTGEVHLSDWVVNALFGVPGNGEPIRPDERLEWHLYLKELEDTGSFFKDLESN